MFVGERWCSVGRVRFVWLDCWRADFMGCIWIKLTRCCGWLFLHQFVWGECAHQQWSVCCLLAEIVSFFISYYPSNPSENNQNILADYRQNFLTFATYFALELALLDDITGSVFWLNQIYDQSVEGQKALLSVLIIQFLCDGFNTAFVVHNELKCTDCSYGNEIFNLEKILIIHPVCAG